MSILSEVIGGRLNVLQAALKVVPYIQRLTSGGTAVHTPQPPAAPNGAADQIETVRDAIKGYVHAYLAAKLGTGIAEQLAERVVDVALTALVGVIEGALHGAAAAKTGPG